MKYVSSGSSRIIVIAVLLMFSIIGLGASAYATETSPAFSQSTVALQSPNCANATLSSFDYRYTRNQQCLIQGEGIPDINVNLTSVTETHYEPPQTTTITLTIENVGDATLDWHIIEEDLPVMASTRTDETAPISSLGSIGAIGWRFTLEGSDIIEWADVPEADNFTSIAPMGRTLPAGDYIGSDFSTLYALDYNSNEFLKINTSTGAETVVGTSIPSAGHFWHGLSYDRTTDTLYADASSCNESSLYTIDPSNGTATLIGAVSNADCLVDIAVSPGGQMYGVDLVNDITLAIDKNTGVGTVLGSTGIDASFVQGMDFDDSTCTLYWASFNLTAFNGELRTIDLNTGASSLIGAFGTETTEIDAFAIQSPSVGECEALPDIPWLTVSPTNNSTAPGGSTAVTLTFDSTELEPGVYFGRLYIASTDPDENPIIMPITFGVSAGPTAVTLGSLTQSASGIHIADFTAACLLLLVSMVLLFRHRQ